MDIGNNVLRNILGGKKTKGRSGGYIKGESARGRIAEKMKGKDWFQVKDISDDDYFEGPLTRKEAIEQRNKEHYEEIARRKAKGDKFVHDWGPHTHSQHLTRSNAAAWFMENWQYQKPESELERRPHPKNPRWHQYRIPANVDIRYKKK